MDKRHFSALHWGKPLRMEYLWKYKSLERRHFERPSQVFYGQMTHLQCAEDILHSTNFYSERKTSSMSFVDQTRRTWTYGTKACNKCFAAKYDLQVF